VSTATLTAPTTAPTGTSMGGLVAAQLIKLRTRGGLVLLALNVLLPLGVLVLVLAVGQQAFDLAGADLAGALTSSIGEYTLLAPLLGALVAGADHRHGTIVPTVRAEPRRGRVAVASLLVAAATAAAVAAACALLGAAIALPWLAAQDVPIGEVLADPDLWWRALGQTAVVVVMSLVGAALAILMRGVLGPVLVLIGAILVQGTLAAFGPPSLIRWMFHPSVTALTDPTAITAVPVWQPVLIVLGVLGVLVTAALLSARHRDV
jgi:hypothetical protein